MVPGSWPRDEQGPIDALEPVPLLEGAEGGGGGRIEGGRAGGAAVGARALQQGATAVGDAAVDREQVLLDQPGLAHVGRVERHELEQRGLVVAMQGHGGEEPDRAGAQAEVVEAVGAMAGLEGAAPLEQHRHDVLAEEGLPRAADAGGGRLGLDLLGEGEQPLPALVFAVGEEGAAGVAEAAGPGRQGAQQELALFGPGG